MNELINVLFGNTVNTQISPDTIDKIFKTSDPEYYHLRYRNIYGNKVEQLIHKNDLGKYELQLELNNISKKLQTAIKEERFTDAEDIKLERDKIILHREKYTEEMSVLLSELSDINNELNIAVNDEDFVTAGKLKLKRDKKQADIDKFKTSK